jgi:hypothetical protein
LSGPGRDSLEPMRSWGLMAIALGTLLACKALKREQPAAQQASAQAAAAPSASAPSTSTVSASPDEPMEWAAGQWTRHRLKTATLTYKILKRTGEDYLVEVVSQHTGQPFTVIQIEISHKGVKDVKNWKIKSARLKLPGGQIQEFKGALLGPMQNMYKGMLGTLKIPDTDSLPREDVTVEAGRFSSCVKFTYTPEVPGLARKGTSWAHFSVPISALIKSVAEDGTTQMELVAYGLSGAQSEM